MQRTRTILQRIGCFLHAAGWAAAALVCPQADRWRGCGVKIGK